MPVHPEADRQDAASPLFPQGHYGPQPTFAPWIGQGPQS